MVIYDSTGQRSVILKGKLVQYRGRVLGEPKLTNISPSPLKKSVDRVHVDVRLDGKPSHIEEQYCCVNFERGGRDSAFVSLRPPPRSCASNILHAALGRLHRVSCGKMSRHAAVCMVCSMLCSGLPRAFDVLMTYIQCRSIPAQRAHTYLRNGFVWTDVADQEEAGVDASDGDGFC